MSIKIQLLGSYHILNENQSLPGLNSTRMKLFIARLAAENNAPVSRNLIACKLWPDSPEDQAQTNLRKLIYRFKHSISGSNGFLITDHQTCRLVNSPSMVIDLRGFVESLEKARDPNNQENQKKELDWLEKAVQEYQGDLLPDCDDEWVCNERDRYRSMYTQTLDRIISVYINNECYPAALIYAEKLITSDPLNEYSYKRKMELLQLMNNRAAALSTYYQCATLLERELGVEPSADVRNIYDQLVLKSDRLNPVQTGTLASPVLVDRVTEWHTLQHTWEKVSSGQAQFVFLTGEAGIGKTRLAGEFSKWAEKQGALVLHAVCYPALDSLPFSVVISWLQAFPLPDLDDYQVSELAYLLPEINGKGPSPVWTGQITKSWQKQHLFETLTKILFKIDRPTILSLDNIQWCDRESVEWLNYFIHSCRQHKIMLLFTLRLEEIDLRPDLVEFIVSVRQDVNTKEIALSRLDFNSSVELANLVASKQLKREELTSIYHETEGIPLFILEMTRSRLTSSNLDQTNGESKGKLPELIHAVIQQRLNHLSVPAKEIAEMGAVFGSPFTFKSLHDTGLVEEGVLIQALDELWKRRIIRENGGCYDYTHEKIREVLYDGISTIRRRWLHQKVAEAMESGLQNQVDGISARLAYHFELTEYPERAISYYEKAAGQARSVFANDHAILYLDRAIRITGNPHQKARLSESKGDVYSLIQKVPDAISAYEQAEELLNRADLLGKVRILRKQAGLTCRLEKEKARRTFEKAEETLTLVKEKTPEFWREWLDLKLCQLEACYWESHPDEITVLLDLMSSPVNEYGSTSQKAAFLHGYVQRNNIIDRFNPNPATIQIARDRLSLINKSGDQNDIAEIQFSLGFILGLAAEFVESDGWMEQASQVARRTGNHNLLLRCLTYLSLNHRRQRYIKQTGRDLDELSAALKMSGLLPYEGILLANRSWVAYHQNLPEKAKGLAERALSIWNGLENNYPIHWPAITPILAILVDKKDFIQIRKYMSILLSGDQMSLGDEIEAVMRQYISIPMDKKLSLQELSSKTIQLFVEHGFL